MAFGSPGVRHDGEHRADSGRRARRWTVPAPEDVRPLRVPGPVSARRGLFVFCRSRATIAAPGRPAIANTAKPSDDSPPATRIPPSQGPNTAPVRPTPDTQPSAR
jgi:hypothetical protein